MARSTKKKFSAKKLERDIAAYLAAPAPAPASSGLISEVEGRRLDELAAYNCAILGRLSGDDLERALAGEVRRRGRSDRDLREDALRNVHPDDLVAALARAGHSLQSVGLSGVRAPPR